MREMRFVVGLIAIFVLVETASAEKTRIVLIPTALDHPWATHMYGKGCEILAKCLNQNPDVEAVVSPDLDWPKDPSILEGADAIVYYSRAAGDIVLAPERKEEVLRLLREGVGYVAIHWSTATGDAKYGEEYLDILGGWFHFDHCGLKVDTLPLIRMAPEHPVCRGWESYPVMDEFYLNLKFHENTQPILKVDVDGTDQVVAWVLEREDGGRSFGTTLGHFHSNFSIPAFRKAIVNGILWAAKADLPAMGSSIELPAEDLNLPGDKPQNLPGLHNVMRLSDRILSGSEPDPEKGIETLKNLGVKTVVSVDGAKPAVDRARELGMRYVHIPIGYGGVDEAAGLAFARLVREATGPFYIHCHHGKHRGPAAAAVAYIAEVSCEGKEALFVLERVGTSPDYPGLWRDVENYTPPAPGVELPALVEVAQVDSMVAAMASVDRHSDNLKLLHGANWELLADHPDLVPTQEALLVREGLHEAGRQLEKEEASDELKGWMTEAETVAQRIEDALKEGDKAVASEHFDHLVQSCKQCHAKYRD